MVSKERLDVYCCGRGVFCCCCCFLQQTGAVCGVWHNFQNYMHNKITILCQSEHAKIPPHAKHTHIKKHFLYIETPYIDLRAGSTRKLICLTYPVSSPQRIGAPPRRDRGCQNTCLDVPLAYVSRSSLSREQLQLALSKLENNLLR